MIGRVVAMSMPGRPFVILAFVVAVLVLGDLCFELSVPFSFGHRERYWIMRRRVRSVGQQRAEGHREGDDEAKNGSADAVRHD